MVAVNFRARDLKTLGFKATNFKVANLKTRNSKAINFKKIQGFLGQILLNFARI